MSSLKETHNDKLPPSLYHATKPELDQYQAYLNAKQMLPRLRSRGDTTDFEAAIAAYERRMGLAND